MSSVYLDIPKSKITDKFEELVQVKNVTHIDEHRYIRGLIEQITKLGMEDCRFRVFVESMDEDKNFRIQLFGEKCYTEKAIKWFYEQVNEFKELMEI